jgi:hypothetical protein
MENHEGPDVRVMIRMKLQKAFAEAFDKAFEEELGGLATNTKLRGIEPIPRIPRPPRGL